MFPRRQKGELVPFWQVGRADWFFRGRLGVVATSLDLHRL